ncbi:MULTISPECIES: PleD family two-component system response regulator [unclassified Beijerinckia]|uniref:PleD family two-component system response regulator n=1 Tax=unclassified Beijerinckia TaxID=2638183 RepID=UPI00089CFACA|nr:MULTISPECIES: PleD family two-component system response regulator [unclassified Beijerinckia]MDH7794506.1 two-component system cell cycle response regulator [Beijerinckia sp. GAS462]SEB64651.1 response regulator receiver modulated diguanylate cyclase [Beijerinckia sp. 28-YEA-48]
MTARVLVVDDILANTKLLEARLTAEYFDVLTATNGADALALCADSQCDIILLDVMMPEMDGFEVCRRLKADPATAHIPVIMVTALDQPADRVKGLEMGADDFLTKPVDEVALIARVRSLARLKVTVDELRNRARTAASMGASSGLAAAIADQGTGARVLVVDDRASSSERITRSFEKIHFVDLEHEPQNALFRAAEGEYELIVVSLSLKDFDGLRLCSQLRSLERTRHLPILLVADLDDRAKVLRGLDLGVNDYISRPVDKNELIARSRTQVRRKRYSDALNNNVQASIELALIDALTGLYNRRYLEMHLAEMLAQATTRARPLALMILDIDHFKTVNDTHGHDAGDDVLKGFAARVKNVIRSADLICRLGGEEFVVVMPDTSMVVARRIAERVRRAVEESLFGISNGTKLIPITVSIGLSQSIDDADPDTLFRRADQALYRSKNEGRNRVTADAA